MNEENGQIPEKLPEEKSGETHPPVPAVDTAESNKDAAESADLRAELATLEHLSRWARFKKWLFPITAPEAGMFLLTLVIAGSTTCYTIYAKRQWKVINDQLSVMQQGERPWVSITQTCLMTDLLSEDCVPLPASPITPLWGRARFMNLGRTPAFHVTYITHFTPSNIAPDKFSDVECDESTRTSTDAVEKHPLFPQESPNAGDDTRAIPSHPPELILYAAGCVFYQEGNTTTWHWTKFCTYYEPHGRDFWRSCTRKDSNDAN